MQSLSASSLLVITVGSHITAALPQQFSLNIGFDSPSPQDAPFELTFHRSPQNSQPSIVTSAPLVMQSRPVQPSRKNLQSSFVPQQQQQQQEVGFQQNRQNFQSSSAPQQSFQRSSPPNSQTFRSNTNNRGSINERQQTPTNRKSQQESHQDALRKNELHRKQLAEVVAQHNKKVELQNGISQDSQDGTTSSRGNNLQRPESQLSFSVNNKKKKTGSDDVRKFLFVSSKKSKDPTKKKQIKQYNNVPKEYERHLESLQELNNRIDSLTARVQRYFKAKKQRKPYETERRESQYMMKDTVREEETDVRSIRKAKGLIPVGKRYPRKNSKSTTK